MQLYYCTYCLFTVFISDNVLDVGVTACRINCDHSRLVVARHVHTMKNQTYVAT